MEAGRLQICRLQISYTPNHCGGRQAADLQICRQIRHTPRSHGRMVWWARPTGPMGPNNKYKFWPMGPGPLGPSDRGYFNKYKFWPMGPVRRIGTLGQRLFIFYFYFWIPDRMMTRAEELRFLQWTRRISKRKLEPTMRSYLRWLITWLITP